MSVIFGLLYKNGKPVSDELETMYAGMRRFPHESHAFAAHGCCGFGHMLTYNTPEAVGESMPKWLEDERLLFTAEGRIDNRGELFDLLGINAAQRAAMPDGDLLLAAYRKWGEACTERLLGKWSLAAFHAGENRLFLARDKWDYTNITYYADGDVFAFASSERGLLPLPFIPKEIDEIMVARLLIVWPGDHDQSYFKGLRHLLPSHLLQVAPDGERLRRYWSYADIFVRRGLKLETYTDDLFDVLDKAVTARLRSYKPIAATLSGGMDSSTVCMLAAGQLAKDGRRLRTYTHVPQFAPSGSLAQHRFGDERPFVEAIVDAAGNIDPLFLHSEEVSPMTGISEAMAMCGQPFHGAANAYWIYDIYRTAMQEGCGTMLMGEFGNATTSWTGVEDALPAAEIFRRQGIAGVVKRKLLKPALYGDNPIGHLYKRMAFGRRPWDAISYCSEAFTQALDLQRRVKESGFDSTFKYYFSDPKDMALRVLDLNVMRLPFGAEFGSATGIEFRDPLGDPRVIEATLAIPNEMFFGDMDKWVLRTMMKGKLPDVVRMNDKKGKQSADFAARLYAHRGEMDRKLAGMEAYGFGRMVDMGKIRRQWEALQANPDGFPVDTAAHMVRPIAAYELYRMYQL